MAKLTFRLMSDDDKHARQRKKRLLEQHLKERQDEEVGEPVVLGYCQYSVIGCYLSLFGLAAPDQITLFFRDIWLTAKDDSSNFLYQLMWSHIHELVHSFRYEHFDDADWDSWV